MLDRMTAAAWTAATGGIVSPHH